MSNSNEHLKNRLNNLIDDLTDNIINTPDEEILKEVKEDYGNPTILFDKFNDILKKSRISARRVKK